MEESNRRLVSFSSEDSANKPVSCTATPLTAGAPGAIGIIQLHGEVEPILRAITGRDEWPIGRMRRVEFADIDEGLAGRVTDCVAQLMPHGGMRVMRRLLEALIERGVTLLTAQHVEPADLYPEAQDRIEALMLHALSRARSPLAIDLLLDQPARWRARPVLTEEDEARSRVLSRLIDPPLVVLAGPANVGKSTLSNRLLGRSMSIELDQAGTTRDYTGGMIDLRGLVVHWHDTPGLRETEDPIEQRAIALARRLMEHADLLIAITDSEHGWPRLPRGAGLRIGNKCDVRVPDDADLCVSAVTGEGVEELTRLVRDRLVASDALAHSGPWRFDPRL